MHNVDRELARSTASACPFCGGADSKTLTADANDASLILFGKLSNARLDPKDSFAGQTDLEIETVVKSHPILAGRKVITLPRYLPPDPEYKFLVFCDVYKGQLDPYRGEPVKADSRIAGYLKGALAVKDKAAPTRLKYFFEYLEDKDPIVSGDAFKEFGLADYKDYRIVAEKLPAETVARWLRDPNTAAARLGLYASIIGHCGTKEHAKLLRDILDDPQRRLTSGMDGVMAGYVLLQPKEGWAYVSGLLKDAKLDFGVRYAALRAVRFFHDYRPDVISGEDMTAALANCSSRRTLPTWRSRICGSGSAGTWPTKSSASTAASRTTCRSSVGRSCGTPCPVRRRPAPRPPPSWPSGARIRPSCWKKCRRF